MEPLQGCGEDRGKPLDPLRGTSLQGVQRIVQGIDHRQQVDHSPAQFLDVAHGLRPGPFVGQLADHQLQGIEGGHHRSLQRADFPRLDLTTEEALAVGHGATEPLAHRVIEHRGQAPGPEQTAHHRRADNAEKDFLGTCLCHIPHRQRVIHHRQGDQRQGVTGEHQRVAVGGTQVHGEEQQGAGPQRNDHHQHIGALHKHRHEQQGRRRAGKGTDGTVQGLGAGRPDKRAGNDVDRGHRPVRPRHLHEHGDVQRNHRRRERPYPVEPVASWRHARKKSAQDGVTAACSAVSNARITRSAASRSAGSIPWSTSRRRRTNSTSTACTSSRPASVRLRHLARRS